MIRKFLIVSFLLSFCFCLHAQKHPYNVVFDLTGNDTSIQKSVLRWVSGIIKSNPEAKLEVVMYGQGIDLVVKGRAFQPDIVEKLATNANVSFSVCEIALKHHNLTTTDLLAGVKTVPDGIYEIVSKQADGWAYIKAAR